MNARTVFASLAVATLAAACTKSHDPGGGYTFSSGSVGVSFDDRHVLVADADHRALFVLDAKSGTQAARVDLAAVPAEVLPVDGGAFVTLRDVNEVVYVRGGSWKVERRAKVGEEPIGLARSPDGRRLYVANMTGRSISVLEATSLERAQADVEVGLAPRSIAVVDDGRVYVGDFLAGTVSVVDPAAGSVKREIPLNVPSDTSCGGGDERFPSQVAALAVSPDGRRLYAAHVQSRLDILPQEQWRWGAPGAPLAQAVAPAVGTIELANDTLLLDPVDPWNRCWDGSCDESRDYPPTLLVTACAPPPGMDAPSAIIVDPSGEWIFVADHNSDAVAVLSAKRQQNEGFMFPERGLFDVVRVGARPTGLALGRDLRHLYVHAAFDHSVTVLGTRTGSPSIDVLRRYEYAKSPLPAGVDRGRRLFFSAVDPRMTEPQLGGLSCSSCHPDGRTDGLTWQITQTADDGTTSVRPRNTPALWNVSQSRAFHWSGVAESLPAFTNRMVETMGGRGLSASDQADLESYLATLAPPKALPTNELVAHGRTLFDGKAGCASCHSGALFTDGTPRVVAAFDRSEAVPTPSLRGVRATPPYLHDGSAQKLSDVLGRFARQPEHRAAEKLDENELRALTTYVESL